MDKKSSKVYGADMLTQLRELEKKQTALRNKVSKRLCFLLDNSDDPYLEGFDCGATGSYTVEMMIFVIIRVEANYVAQSIQGELFETKTIKK